MTYSMSQSEFNLHHNNQGGTGFTSEWLFSDILIQACLTTHITGHSSYFNRAANAL